MLRITFDNKMERGSQYTLTQIREGFVPTSFISKIPGLNNEKRNWKERSGVNMFGNYPEKDWLAFLQNIREQGILEPLLIFVEENGDILISEGNHRKEAAIQLGFKEVPVEIRYFANSQESVFTFDKYTL